MDKCLKCIHSDTSAYGVLCSICDRQIDENGNCLDYQEEEFMNEQRELLEVEKYFGIAFDEVDERFEKIMWRIQCDYENGTMGKGIDYYASLYGY